jgi:hypothetical protein
MTIEEVDPTLDRLRSAAESVSANLLEIEIDPNRKLLDATTLVGDSAAQWAAASAKLAQLWQWYALLDALLDRAVQLRGTRARPSTKQLADLGALLEGPSIELANEQVPLEQRDLLTGSGAVLRCTPDELLTRMSVAFDESKTVYAAISKAWDTLTPRLQAARPMLDESAQLASALGETEPDDLGLARTRLGELAGTLSSDPLSVSSEDVDTLDASLQAIRRDLSSLDDVTREITGRLADAHDLLAELQHVAQDGDAAHEEALVKIATPAVPEPLSLDATLDAQLEEVAEIARSGAWREARRALEQWTTRAQSLLDQARRIVVDNRAPMEERNQLRGLLDAYQAKATRLGLIEDSALSRMFEDAHTVLYTAPTDLAKAAELIRSYQQMLGESPPVGEMLR